LGESQFGAAKGIKNFVMVTLGTGVGGGIVLGGKLNRGSRGFGGEVGHLVIDVDGPPCPCGGRGHLESYAARPAIVRDARKAVATYAGSSITRLAGGDEEAITAEIVIEGANAGDPAAVEIMEHVGDMLGEALVGLVNVLNPQAIIVGGGIGESCPMVSEHAAARVGAEALAGRRELKVLIAALGNDAGVAGAAALAFEDHDSREGVH
jgi:glucokinase